MIVEVKACPECGASLAQLSLVVRHYAVKCETHGRDHERTQAMLACVACGVVVDSSPWVQFRFTPDYISVRVN